MTDFWREMFSYPGIFMEMGKIKKEIVPERIAFGSDKNQYFLYFKPDCVKSSKVIIWIHGGGWNSNTPESLAFVGQHFAKQGFHCVSLGYRLSPKYKYPCQIEDVCRGFNSAVGFLSEKNIDVSKLIVSGPSAGAHLSSILCYSSTDQQKYSVNPQNICGFIGVGGPYVFNQNVSSVLKALLNQLFENGYKRDSAEPYSLLSKSCIPMLLIQSRHDGLIDFSSAELFSQKALHLGIPCELYPVQGKKNTHTWYTTGMFLQTREENPDLSKLYSWIENLK